MHITEARAPLWRLLVTRRRPRWTWITVGLASGFVLGWSVCVLFFRLTGGLP